MALTNNLVLTLKDHPALAEALAQRQPGDKLTIEVKVTLVENLADSASFDVDGVGDVKGRDAELAETPAEMSKAEAMMADSVMGVMKKGKAA